MIEQIIKTIEEFETIIIHRHVRPDPDAYGSQGGLAEILKESYPNKTIYTVGKEEPTLNFLRRLDVIEDTTYENALVIVVDTANTERICDQRYKLGKKLIKIDHHPNHDAYGDLLWIDTNASSVSEMIYEFYEKGKEFGLKMNTEAARLLFAGIVGDTGRFLFPNSTRKTFAYAGELIRYPFNRTELFDQMYEMPPELIKLQGYVLLNFQMVNSKVAYVELTKELLNAHGIRSEDASLLVNSLRDIQGLKAWVVFIEEEDQIRVRFRSKGPIINTVAQKYGGGGHPLAAGASIHSWEEKEQVLQDIKEICE